MGGGYGVGGAGAGGFSSPGVGAGAARVSGRMGEQGGLRTGWLAAFSTEGYEGEPPLQEELGVNFGHIKAKVCLVPGCACCEKREADSVFTRRSRC